MMNISSTDLQRGAGRIEVYTDGRCPLCLWLRARVEPFDREARIEWLDYNEPQNQLRAAPHTPVALAEEMHVRRTDGTWSKGFDAWLDVLRVLPRWRWSARVLALWPFTAVGPVFYRWLASRRYKLFGVPPPCDADGVCQLHSK
jgi:predicted DCC family thiol-disulfide oxidoreductase YuxK